MNLMRTAGSVSRRHQIEKEVSDFASKHLYFSEVADDIDRFIRSGMGLRDAYLNAVYERGFLNVPHETA